MKQLTKHLLLHRARNRCNVVMGAQLERIMTQFRYESNLRWEQMETDLRLQRCKLNESIRCSRFFLIYS